MGGIVIDPAAWYTPVAVAAAVPGLSKANLAQMRSRGQGPAYTQHKAGGRVLYSGADLIAWLASARRVPGAAA